jgi:hypothetical protein
MKRTRDTGLYAAAVLGILSGALAFAGCGSSAGPAGSAAESTGTATDGLDRDDRYNRRGNILISDQFNNRVIEIDRQGQIVWHFGLGPNDSSDRSVLGVNDAQRVGTLTLIAGTGAPPGTEPAFPAGLVDNRVILVDRRGRIVWQYGKFGVTGAGPDELDTPVQATFTPNLHVLITDQANERIIDVSVLSHQITWQYGTTGVAGSGPDQLDSPNSAELLANGHLLLADENNDRAIEVDRDKNIVATFTAGGTVSGAAFASRLSNGDTLITDSNNSRIVEVDASDVVVWQYLTNTDPASNAAPLPTRAVRLENGDTLISDQFNDRVIEVNRSGAIVARFGNLDTVGYGTSTASQGLSGPYDAKVIGDYAGLTPPFGHDFD